MRNITFASLLLLSSISAAAAADMPVKASQQGLVFPYNGSGFYWGVDVEAGVAQTKSSGLFGSSLVTGNLNAAGGAVGGTIGYIVGNGTNWWAVEATVDYQNITGATTIVDPTTGAVGTASQISRWQASQVVKFGGFSAILNSLPSLGIQFPALPALPTFTGLASTSHSYIMAGAQEFGVNGVLGSVDGTSWAVAPLVGMGMLTQMVDAAGRPTGAVVDLYAKVVFGDKSIVIDHIFAPSGPPTLAGHAAMGKQYFSGIKILY